MIGKLMRTVTITVIIVKPPCSARVPADSSPASPQGSHSRRMIPRAEARGGSPRGTLTPGSGTAFIPLKMKTITVSNIHSSADLRRL